MCENMENADLPPPPQPNHLEVLKKYFGHSEFKPAQWRIISSLINEKRDNFAVMTTGYGKSLCYQYPSVYLGGVTLVVSPLIALMKDQVSAMHVRNIPACLLGSGNTQQYKTKEEILKNKYRLVYITPEFCFGSCGKALLKDMLERLTINLIAIDEAHCITTWGYDFRVEFRQLGVFKRMKPNIPILAVTATATAKTREDIIQVINLQNPQVTCHGFDRPNLFFSFHCKRGSCLADFKKVMVYDEIEGRWKFSGLTIVYCLTKHETDAISKLLSGLGCKCRPYHAGLPMERRKETQEKFMNDELDVIVATLAFGMGIDKPDVRNVIHYGSPCSVEAYYQEVGRAGRDGLPAKCITFYSRRDFTEFHWWMMNKASLRNCVDIKMWDFLNTRDCRRQFLLSYFEGKQISTAKSSDCCDNCVKSLQADEAKLQRLEYDYADDVRILLEAIRTVDGKDERWWDDIGTILENEELIEKRPTFDKEIENTIHLSTKGKTLLKNNGKKAPMFAPPREKSNTERSIQMDLQEFRKKPARLASVIINQQQQRPSTSRQNVTAEEDKQKRCQIASSEHSTPSTTVTNEALMNTATTKPLEQSRNSNCSVAVKEKKSMEELLVKRPLITVGGSERRTFTHFKAGYTVEEMAQFRGMPLALILTHLEGCIKIGLPIKLIELGVTDEIKETIIDAIKTVDTGLSQLTPIKNACPPHITSSQISVVVSYLTVRQHLNHHNLEYDDFDDGRGIESIPDELETTLIRNEEGQPSPKKKKTRDSF